MLNHPQRGPGRGSCREVCTTRELNVFGGMFSLFYHVFYALEDAGLLDATDDAEQQQLNVFRESYSHHRIRGQNNRSPYQWIQGMAHLNTDETALTGAIGDSFSVSNSLRGIHPI